MSAGGLLADAKKLACALLAGRDKSEEELRRKLSARGFPPPIIDEALADLRALGYVDDKKYLLRAARTLTVNRKWGERKITAALKEKGFTPEEIEAAIAEVKAEPEAGEILRKLIARMRARTSPWDLKAKRRLFNRLVGRGFAPAEILNIMREYNEEFLDDHDGK